MGDIAAPAARARELIDLAGRAVTAYDRPDLAAPLERMRRRVDERAVRVLVVGEFKQGKSSLVNALVAAPVCPVDDDVATSVPTTVRYAETPRAAALYASEAGGAPRRHDVALDEVAAWVSEAGNPGNERAVAGFEIGLPRELLRGGLVLVDTPGVGGLGSTHSAATVAALPTADAVVLVTDASQELTEPELVFLQMARDLCPTQACVVTKTDFHPDWRTITELDRAHLAARDLTMPVLPTSASLRTMAAERTDAALNVESGVPALLDFLRGDVEADAATRLARAAGEVVVDVADQLAGRFDAERRALTAPGAAADLVADLEAAKTRATALRGQAARWQQTLSDGVADLVADADHDLRARLREISVTVDEAIEDVDPGEVWDDLEQWLYRMVNAQVATCYAQLTERARDLVERVATHFADAEPVPAGVGAVDVSLERLREIAPARAVEATPPSLSSRGLTALRGSYGGVMMTGILGSMMGFALFNPVSLGFGVVLGRKAIRDEQERAVIQRRAQARQACRTYVDDVGFALGKDTRDGLRHLQRRLRDTFTEEAAALQRSTTEALDAARAAIDADRDERTSRLRDVEAELARIEQLRAAARELASAGRASEEVGQ